MSGMVFGGMVEADYTMRMYEVRMRAQRKLKNDQAKWQRYIEEHGKDDDDDE